MLQETRYWLGCLMLKVFGVQTLEDVLSARGYHVVTHEWTERIQGRLFSELSPAGCVILTRGCKAGPDHGASLTQCPKVGIFASVFVRRKVLSASMS